MYSVWGIIEPLVPALITLIVVIAVLWSADQLLVRNAGSGNRHRSSRQLVMIMLTLCSALAVVLSLPITDKFRTELLGLLGIVLTGLIAFSSTTFVANMMAGLMLRSIKSFSPGDFIEAGTFFGKVTERALFHTEIQSEDRDLITLPNLYLATNPVKVVRSSGTAINCVLSLGYDVPHARVVKTLKGAARSCELDDPFVQILELGDFSVTYKAAGFYKEIRHLLSKRSEFKAAVLDALHREGIEIVSPAFMNQRVLDRDAPVIPEVTRPLRGEAAGIFPETKMFDKANRAERIQMLEDKREQLKAQMKEFKKADGESIEGIEAQIEKAELLLQREMARETDEQ